MKLSKKAVQFINNFAEGVSVLMDTTEFFIKHTGQGESL